VRRWYENTARGAEVTADVYLRRVGFFCAKHNLTPRRLAGLGEKKATQLLLDTVSDLERKQHAGSYIKSIVGDTVHTTSRQDRQDKRWKGHGADG